MYRQNESGMLSLRSIVGIAAAIAFIGVIPSDASAQAPDVISACYVPTSGTIYRVEEPNLRADCTSKHHIAFQWNAQGPIGATGLQGPAGPTGATGSQGLIGQTGPAGPQGTPGVAGSKGDQGAAGPAGPQGIPGTDGATGAIGATGATGAAGAVGATGAPGLQGPNGDKGDAGPQGLPGAAGIDGAVGSQGPAGTDGAAGVAGSAGGLGPVGPPGPAGPKGDTGPIGPGGTVSFPLTVTQSAGVALLGLTNTGAGGGIFVNGNTASAIVAQNNSNTASVSVVNTGTGAALFATGSTAIFAKGNIAFQTNSPQFGIRFGDGTFQSTAAAGGGGGLTLPFNGSTSSPGSAFGITNTGSGPALQAAAPNNATGPAVEFTGGGSGIALELRGYLRLGVAPGCVFPQTCNGIRFADGTVQTTAAAGGGGGLTGYQVVSQSTSLSTIDTQGLAVFCPGGKRAIGGGVSFSTATSGVPYPQMVTSTVDPSGNAWNGKGYKANDGNQWQMTVSAVCANASP